MPIDWSNTPPTDQPWQGTRLLRCPTASPLAGITLDCQLLGCRTHYAGGRTQPCQGTACKLCLDGHTWRWHGYLPLYNPSTGKQIVLEIPAAAAEDYHRQISQYQSRAGIKLTVRRASKRPNARVLLALEPYAPNGTPLPTPIDVARYLEHMWGVDQPAAPEPPKRGLPTEHKRHYPANTPAPDLQTLQSAIEEALSL